MIGRSIRNHPINPQSIHNQPAINPQSIRNPQSAIRNV